MKYEMYNDEVYGREMKLLALHTHIVPLAAPIASTPSPA